MYERNWNKFFVSRAGGKTRALAFRFASTIFDPLCNLTVNFCIVHLQDRSRHRSRGSSYSPPPSHRSELISAQTIGDICRKTPKVWDGGLILKNSLFPTKLHLIEGDRGIADDLISDDTEGCKNQLKITQRLRLDQSKLDDVSKRMTSSASHAIFLGLTTSTPVEHGNPEVQSRPLRNLISYLKQKEAAGVISLNEVHQGVLYCFPPCSFSLDLLRREAPSLLEEGKDDYLVVVVVCGNHSWGATEKVTAIRTPGVKYMSFLGSSVV